MPREVFSIICDDLRMEEGNKASLMGMYSNGIIVPQLPFAMKLCLYQELEDVENVKNLRVELRGPKLSLKAALTPKSKQPTTKILLRVLFGLVQFEEEGDYRFETYIEDSKEPAATKPFFVKIREDLKIT